MDNLKVAIIGIGKMGLLHSSILSTIPGVEVAALCDKSYVLRRIAKKLFKNSTIKDDVAKLSNLSLDCAYVTAPIPAHFPIINALYSNNITRNIFVEKTLASNSQRANEICELSEKYPGVNMVGYMKRFSVTFLKAKRLLNDNALGDLLSFQGSAYSSDFVDCTESMNTLSRGGVLSDLGSHVIELALWFFGEFVVEKAEIKSLIGEKSEDYAHFRVKNSNLSGEFDISWCKDNYRLPSFSLTIQGTQGTLSVNDFNLVLDSSEGKHSVWYRPDLNDNVPFLLAEPEYYREDERFIASVLKSQIAEPDFKTASKVDHIIDFVKKEAQKN